MNGLGQKIRDLRVEQGLTQSDLASGLITPSMVSQIESGKANPSYKVLEAIAAKLDTPLDYFLSDVNTQMEQLSAHKCAKSLLVSGGYIKAIELLEAIIEKPSLSVNLAEVYADLGRAYRRLQRFDEAEQAFKTSIDISRRKDSVVSVLDALNQLGEMEAERKRYHAAIYHWRQAYEQFERLPEPQPFVQSEVLTNLGNVHSKLGEHTEALAHFQKAYELLASTNHYQQIGMTYLGLGLSYRNMGEYEKATEYSNYAVAVFETTSNAKLSVDVKRNYGVLKREAGEHDAALSVFAQCLNEYSKQGHTNEMVTVHGEIAKLYLREQRFEDAKEGIFKGLSLVDANSHVTLPVLQALAQAYEGLGDHDNAVRHMERAVNGFKQAEENASLVEGYSMLAEVYQKSGEHMKANDCLQQMKQAMHEMLKDRGIIL